MSYPSYNIKLSVITAAVFQVRFLIIFMQKLQLRAIPELS